MDHGAVMMGRLPSQEICVTPSEPSCGETNQYVYPRLDKINQKNNNKKQINKTKPSNPEGLCQQQLQPGAAVAAAQAQGHLNQTAQSWLRL